VKTIGLIGGMSWEATALYYQLLNHAVQQRLGGLHSAKIAMISLDFEEPAGLAREGRWDDLALLLSDAARKLERAGAGVLMIGANTAHRVADAVAAAVSIPLVHICDCTAEVVRAKGLTRVALLGTRYTMEEDFFKDRLVKCGVSVVIPGPEDRERIHRIILDELVLGRVEDPSRKVCLDIVGQLVGEGAEGVVLGCTELPLLLKPDDCPVPLFDTTQIHALSVVGRALV